VERCVYETAAIECGPLKRDVVNLTPERYLINDKIRQINDVGATAAKKLFESSGGVSRLHA
jgi:hypothetical protein